MKLRKILATTLALVMVVAAPVVAKADLASEDATFTDKVADGSAAWNSAGTGVTFPINADGVTVVFANDAFTDSVDHGNGDKFGDAYDNWDNFVIETIATTAAKGVTLRADAYGWTYGDATHTPTYAAETSWGTDWTNFNTLTDDTTVTVVAKKTSDTTVEFAITFASDAAAWEKYTVTYPDGVPADLSFQIGADGGKVTLTSVDFPGDEEPEEKPEEIEPKGDMSFAFTAMVVVAGVALVAFASKKRFA